MNNRAPDFIKRAEHCLRTKQINVASRYMLVATNELAEQRTRPLDEIREVRIARMARQREHLCNVTLPDMGKAFSKMGEAIKLAFAESLPALKEAMRQSQAQMREEMDHNERLAKAARQAMREAEVKEEK